MRPTPRSFIFSSEKEGDTMLLYHFSTFFLSSMRKREYSNKDASSRVINHVHFWTEIPTLRGGVNH